MILGFASYGYRRVAKLWYDQLTFLGYTSHRIGAFDQDTYDLFKRYHQSN